MIIKFVVYFIHFYSLLLTLIMIIFIILIIFFFISLNLVEYLPFLICWTIFIWTTINIYFYGSNKILSLIQMASLILILILNISDVTMMFIIPLSKDKISFFYEFPSEIIYGEFETKEIKLNRFDDFKDFFKNELTNWNNYVGYFSINYKGQAVFIIITEFFLFNKYSSVDILESYMEENVIHQESFIVQNFKDKYNREDIRITLYYSKFEII